MLSTINITHYIVKYGKKSTKTIYICTINTYHKCIPNASCRGNGVLASSKINKNKNTDDQTDDSNKESDHGHYPDVGQKFFLFCNVNYMYCISKTLFRLIRNQIFILYNFRRERSHLNTFWKCKETISCN